MAYRKIVIIIILIIFNNVFLASQLKKSNPLRPSTGDYTQVNIGIIISAGQNIQNGLYNVECPDCEFKGGVGSGSMLGLYYQRGLTKNLHYGLMGFFDWWDLDNTFFEDERTLATDRESGQEIGPFQLQFENNSLVTLSTFSVAPYLKYQLTDWFFLRLSVPITFPFSSSLTHEKKLITKTIEDNGRLYLIEQTTDPLLQEGDFPNINSPLFSLGSSFGFNIQMSERFSFNPAFYYRVGLNDVSSNGEKFRINSWRILLEFNIAISKKPSHLKTK